MAATLELTQEAVLRFLAERGGRAPNADLLEHFRGFLNSPEPQRRARARECFKALVNAVATVRQEPGSGAKYVQLRKKYRSAAAAAAGGTDGPGAAPAAGGASVAAETPRLLPEPQGGGGGDSDGRSRGGDAAPEAESHEEEEEAVAESSTSAASVPEGGGPSPPSQRQPEAAAPPPNGTEPPQPRLEPSEGGGTAGLRGRAGGEVAGAEPCGGSGQAQHEGSLLPPTLLASLAAALPGGGAPLPAASTPRCGSKNFRERVLGSSPQLKRGGLLSRGGSGGSSRGAGDSDSASLASSSAEDETGSGGGSVALDPLEHAWMLCASDGRWESLEGLLSCEPALLSKRDFITGFTCLHWAAKHGRHELLAMLVNFAHRHRLPVNVNARTSGGYTALHLAAMHGHLEVVKLLVGAYDADVDIRDYSGRKASHYLSRGTAEEVGSLVGALQDEADGGAPNGSGRWRLSKVLPSNLISYKLSHLHHRDEGESGDGTPGKGKELSRKTSGSGRMKPRLNKIRFRTQIIHTTPSFQGDAEEEGQEEKSLKASFKLRPKSNVFG